MKEEGVPVGLKKKLQAGSKLAAGLPPPGGGMGDVVRRVNGPGGDTRTRTGAPASPPTGSGSSPTISRCPPNPDGVGAVYSPPPRPAGGGWRLYVLREVNLDLWGERAPFLIILPLFVICHLVLFVSALVGRWLGFGNLLVIKKLA